MVHKTHDKVLLAFSIGVFAISTLFYYLFQSSDPARCKAVLEDGFWLNPSALSNWQPASCMLHSYRSTEAASCLVGKRIVFIGGSSTLNLYEAFAQKIDPSTEQPPLPRESNQMRTLPGNIRLEFQYDPFLEESALQDLSLGTDSESNRPTLLVLGNELDFLKREDNLPLWTEHIAKVTATFAGNAADRMRQAAALVMTPLLELNWDQVSDADLQRITPEKLDTMNQVLAIYGRQNDIDVAFAFNKVLDGPGSMSGSGTVAPKALNAMTDILLNRVCNIQLPKHYPYASTCCNTYPKANWVQLLGFVFVAVLVPAAVYLHYRGYTPESSAFLRYMPSAKYLQPILILGLTVVLCYYCDRTNILGKEQKQTSPSQFFILMGIIIVASLWTLKTSDKDLAFLNRDQTDEWKGWMQVAILVYHYVGVSKTEYIYNYMRVCPTSYLFMTGFGHTVYFLKKDDFSFKRVVATMLRLNLLNVILAYAMGNDWLLYYFAPLVTWNFFVLFFLLYAGHQYNKNLKFVYAKIAAAALLNTAFNRLPGLLEAAWSLLQLLFRMQGDLREWRFRVTLDQYSMFPGMICGILFINWEKMELTKSRQWPQIQKLLYAGCLAIMLGYAVFELSQPSKVVYNTKHTYVSWLPCCAFVILRNATPWLRNTHNEFFAWVGRGSLETFLLQFHIWLAADTAGLLMVGPAHWRFANAIVMTVIFMYISSLVTTATGSVIEWVMAADKTVRPGLPTSFKSHPIVPKEGHLNGSAVPLNGQVVEMKLQDPSKLDQKVSHLETGQTGSSASSPGIAAVAWKDLRVRVGLILGAMAIMNWTYYI